MLYNAMNFDQTYFTINRGENLAPPERPEIKHQDEALGCTFLSRFLSLISFTQKFRGKETFRLAAQDGYFFNNQLNFYMI